MQWTLGSTVTVERKGTPSNPSSRKGMSNSRPEPAAFFCFWI